MHYLLEEEVEIEGNIITEAQGSNLVTQSTLPKESRNMLPKGNRGKGGYGSSSSGISCNYNEEVMNESYNIVEHESLTDIDLDNILPNLPSPAPHRIKVEEYKKIQTREWGLDMFSMNSPSVNTEPVGNTPPRKGIYIYIYI